MTLTTLRRLVLSGTVVSLAAAGGAAWFAVGAEAAPRPDSDWQKIFPVKSTAGIAVGTQLPGPLPEYQAAALWPQGEKPVVVEEGEKPVEKPPDPFESKYRLKGVFVGSHETDSHAQITAAGISMAFSILVGERIPRVPGDESTDLTPWRLDAVRLAEGGGPSRAVFHHVDTFEEKTLTVATTSGAELVRTGGPGGAAAGANGGPGPGAGTSGRTPERPRAILLRADPVKGEYEWRIPEDDGWWGDYSDEEAAKIATVASRDAEGNPDGFVIKGLQPGSRARDLGFQQEDKVISVNREPVHSLEHAISTGKRQYDEGASSFQVKAIRNGKEVNYTFHATKKRTRKTE